MKKSNIVLILAAGLIGGLAATTVDSYAENKANSRNSNVLTEISSEEGTAVSGENDGDGYGYVDLRKAANNTVKTVVHVKIVTQGPKYLTNPLEYYFGAEPQIREAPGNMGSGSGVIISQDGFIVTNNHVIDKSNKITVALYDQKEYTAKLIGTDPETDIALLKIDAKDLPSITFGNSDDIDLGEWVLAVGNPYNLTSTVTAGIISAKSRNLSEGMNFESFIQTDAAINPGNSGGALVNADGKLIGINTAIQSPTGSYSGYSFAVPSNLVRKVVEDLMRYGKVNKAGLNVSIIELNKFISKNYDIKEENGIYIAEIVKGGAAEKAGMKEGDILYKMDGKEIKTFAEMKKILYSKAPGDTIQVSVKRNQKIVEMKVTLDEM